MSDIRLPEGFVPTDCSPPPYLPGLDDPVLVEAERVMYLRAEVRAYRLKSRGTVPLVHVRSKVRDELSREFEFEFASDFCCRGNLVHASPIMATPGDADAGGSADLVCLQIPGSHIDAAGPLAMPASLLTPIVPAKPGRGRRKPNPIEDDEPVVWSDSAVLMMKHELIAVSLKALSASGNADEKADVLVWIFCQTEADSMSDFSFNNVCVDLNLDPDLIRTKILQEMRRNLSDGEEIIFTFDKTYRFYFKNGKSTERDVPVKFSLDLADQAKPVVELETLGRGHQTLLPECLVHPVAYNFQ